MSTINEPPEKISQSKENKQEVGEERKTLLWHVTALWTLVWRVTTAKSIVLLLLDYFKMSVATVTLQIYIAFPSYLFTVFHHAHIARLSTARLNSTWNRFVLLTRKGFFERDNWRFICRLMGNVVFLQEFPLLNTIIKIQKSRNNQGWWLQQKHAPSI